MEIIEYGHIKPVETWCQGCGAIYSYVPKDIKERRGRSCVWCPVCGRVHVVSVEKGE